MNIFITGGCGFIGSHLCEYYLNKGHKVITVDNLSSGRLENIEALRKNASFSFVEADILEWPDLKETLKWADIIFHFAATVGMFNVVNDPISTLINNLMGCQRLLKNMTEIKSDAIVVIASSSSVYGDSQTFSSENDNLNIHRLSCSTSTYPISKLADEALAYAYIHRHQLNIILARIFNTIGPRQTDLYGMVVPRFIKQACSNEPITIFGDGTQTRSFCDVRDVIKAMDMLIHEPKALGQSINIGNSSEISINDLAQLVRSQANSHSLIQYLSYEEAYGEHFIDITQRCPDLSKLYHLTNFKHQWTLADTVGDLIARKKQLT
ncbi:hypothetical protein B1207_13380 [Legionella quinlivanii]|uniref:NAD-dependent epimerase/dehydratase domain-containing protein n=1 Tax=Legionella quinlivanii TaxID=45073 RepID=A0A364LH64_9GAMM|nr:NAD-dependent epimerase/dehydratase family protein [Legionella quinlivanii]RAP35357.1 hypothetical protein B1207_13380 [Legionella quinlivanii]